MVLLSIISYEEKKKIEMLLGTLIMVWGGETQKTTKKEDNKQLKE